MLAKNLANKSSRAFVQAPKRVFMNYGREYYSGFDRMLIDKLNWFKVKGMWFALFGLGNVILFGQSLLQKKENYDTHFAYTGKQRRLFTSWKSLMACDNIWNVLWTAPILLGGGTYLALKTNPLFTFKFFWFTMLLSSVFYSVFSPASGLNYAPLRGSIVKWLPIKLDSNAKDYSYYMGADTVASAVVLGILFYHRMYFIAGPWMLMDLLYYGPSHMGGPAAALICGLSML